MVNHALDFVAVKKYEILQISLIPIAREDIRVRFSDGAGWEGWADFLPSDVHKQYGIAMKTPKYRDGNIKEKTKVFLELYKPSDESVSEPQDFFFLPPLSLLGPAQVAHPSVK